MARRFSRLLVALFALAAPRAVAGPLDVGDLLIVDWDGNRVLRANPVTHAVSVYSPRNAAQPDLLDGPTDVAIDDAGVAWVVNYWSGRLVRIDPATGEQREVQECPLFGTCSDLDLGEAVGLAVRSTPNNVELWVVSHNDHALTRISSSRILPIVDATQLVTEPFGETSPGLIEDDDGVDQVWYAGASVAAVFSYSTSGGEPVSIYTEPSLHIKALRAHRVGSGNEVFLLRAPADCGTPGTKGVYQLFLGVVPVSENGVLNCPQAMAITPGADPLVIYVLDFDYVTAPRVVAIRESGEEFAQEVVAVLPDGSVAFGAAVSPVSVPEPNAAALAAVALAALVLRRRA